MRYEIRRNSSSEYGRWLIHEAGRPSNVYGRASTAWGARRTVKRWQREDARARTSYPA